MLRFIQRLPSCELTSSFLFGKPVMKRHILISGLLGLICWDIVSFKLTVTHHRHMPILQ